MDKFVKKMKKINHHALVAKEEEKQQFIGKLIKWEN